MATTRTIKSKSRMPTGPMASVADKDLLSFVETSMKVYGTEVNLERSVPDFRDGLKPVVRRLLWAMHQLPGDKAHKSARLVGDCFAAGTLVTLADGGVLPIEELRVGDLVKTDKGNYPVDKLYELPSKDLYEVVTDKGVVQATSDQIFFCIDSAGKEVERTPLTLHPRDKIKSLR